MVIRDLNGGLAPDVTIRNGLVCVVWGTLNDLHERIYRPDGSIVTDRTWPDGFFNSYPRYDRSGTLLVYKSIGVDGFTPIAVSLNTGAVRRFTGPNADGNFPVVCISDRYIGWQGAPPSYPVYIGDVQNGLLSPTSWFGAPDGLEAIDASGPVLRKDIRVIDPAVGGYPQRAGDVMIGQYGQGIGIRLDNERTRWLMGGTVTSDPRIVREGDFMAVVAWGSTVSLAMFTRDEIADLPFPPTEDDAPVVAVGKRLWLAWFTDGDQSTPGNADLFVDYHNEGRHDAIVRARATGEALYQYVSATPDGDPEALARAVTAARGPLPVVAYWTYALQQRGISPPVDIDVLGVEAYRRVDEALDVFEARVRREVLRWPKSAIIAQCYTSNASQTANLRVLVPVYARLAQQVSVEAILPFAGGSRPTGWEDHPEVHASWGTLAQGITGTPIVVHPDPPPLVPPDPLPLPPPPTPPAERFVLLGHFTLGGPMQTERGGLVGPGGKFARATEKDLGKGLNKWYALHFDADSSDGDAEFELTDLGNGHGQAKHTTTGAIFGVDMTKFSTDLTKQFYLKPNTPDTPPEAYESPLLLITKLGTKILAVEYEKSNDVPFPFLSTPVSWVTK